jgi:hypothetical protein
MIDRDAAHAYALISAIRVRAYDVTQHNMQQHPERLVCRRYLWTFRRACSKRAVFLLQVSTVKVVFTAHNPIGARNSDTLSSYLSKKITLTGAELEGGNEASKLVHLGSASGQLGLFMRLLGQLLHVHSGQGT